MSFEKHIPVLLLEAVDALAVKSGGRYVDGAGAYWVAIATTRRCARSKN